MAGVLAGVVDIFLVNGTVRTAPCVRRGVGTNSNRVTEIIVRMNVHRQMIGTVASMNRGEDVLELAETVDQR